MVVGRLNNFIGSLSAVEILIVLGVFVGLGAGMLFIAGLVKRVSKSSEEDIFEPTDIEKIIKPKIKELVSYWGSSTNIKLRYRYDEKGTVEKQLDYTAAIEDADKPGLDVKVDKGQLEKDYNEGRISKRTYKMIKKFSEEKVQILVVRPSGLLNKISWYIFENLLGGGDTVDRIIIVPDRLIRDDVDYMTIKNEAEFTRFAGMDVAVESSAFNFVESIGFRNLYSQALQDQQNYHKQVNFYASRFSQEIQKIREEARAERNKYAGKDTGMVEEEE